MKLTLGEHGRTKFCEASALLSSLAKEKELLKIFLKVSQMENSTLRRMNLSSFLMTSEWEIPRTLTVNRFSFLES